MRQQFLRACLHRLIWINQRASYRFARCAAASLHAILHRKLGPLLGGP
jgi:hypothetical protein